MIHCFDTDIAKEFGLVDAIILNNIAFWVQKNKANKTNFHDGKYWTFNSIKAMQELFPYLSTKQIRSCLDRLETNGLIETGNFNQMWSDRTKWYTLSEKATDICHLGNLSIAPQGKAIPYINTDNNNICSSELNESDSSLEKLETDFEKIYEIYPKKVGKAKAFTRYKQWVQKSGRKVNGRTYHLTNRQIWLAVKKYVSQLEDKDTELQYYKGFDVLMGDSLLDYVDLDK